MNEQARRNWSAEDRALAAHLANGHTNRQIARATGRPPEAVARTVADLLHSHGATCRAHLVALAYTAGALDPHAWPAQPAPQ